MFFTHMAQLINFFLSAVDGHVYMKTEEYMWLYTMDLFYTMQWIFVDWQRIEDQESPTLALVYSITECE